MYEVDGMYEVSGRLPSLTCMYEVDGMYEV